MSGGKEFKPEELNEIRSFLKDGLTYAEVGELMGRNEKSIKNLVHRLGWSHGRFRDVPEVKQEEPAWNEILKEQTQKEETLFKNEEENAPKTCASGNLVSSVVVPPVKEKTLDDFPARKLIKNLYDRGYRIENGELICIVHQVVNVKDIITNG